MVYIYKSLHKQHIILIPKKKKKKMKLSCPKSKQEVLKPKKTYQI